GPHGLCRSRSRGTSRGQVILISGPTALEAPAGVNRVCVRSAAEMLAAVEEHFAKANVGIFAAAVADYRPADAAPSKIKRSGEELMLKLVANTDILATMGRKKGGRLLVGFAAETERVAENARKKLQEKNADIIVANDVTAEGAGFDVDT